MVVSVEIWFPLVDLCYAPFRFRHLNRQIIPIQIEPVVIGAATGPGLILFQIIRIANQVLTLARVYPTGKAVKAVRIDRGINEDDRLIEKFVYGRPLRRGEMVEGNQGGIGAAGLIAMDAMACP